MSRRRGKKGAITFQLFSFLDVLLCTIGGLIIILAMVMHRARTQVEELHAKQAAPSAEEIKKQQEAVEEARWRQEVLEKQRKERQDALQETRLALSHLEDHIRRLNTRGKELMELLEKVKAGKKTKEEDLAAARQELEKIKDELAKKKDELDKKKKEATSAEKWYALIPYDGPNGTRRMPIYIECVAEGVVIQPEGVLLTADDFRGEPSPGNPLDAALRTKREYIMKATGGKAAEPYPLIVVRPSGVLSYGAARACMKFWEDEFGYELISEDKNLDFGPRDPNLDQIMSKEIAQARKRQAVMAMAMPRKYTREEVPRSFAPEDNPEVQRRRETVAGGGVGNGGSGNGLGSGRGGRGGLGNGSNANGGVGGTGPAGGGLAGTGGTGPRGAATGGMPGAQGSGTGPYGSGGDFIASQDPSGSPGAGGTGTGTGGSGGTGPGSAGAGGSNPGSSTAGGGTAGSAKGGSPRLTQPNQGVASTPGAGSFAGGAPGGTSESGGTSPSGSGKSNNNSQANSASGGSASNGGASGGASGGTSGGSPGMTSAAGAPSGSPAGGQSMPNIGLNMGSTDKAPPPGSQKSGKGSGGAGKTAKAKNWGLPEAQRHVSGVTRPIGITMQKDKLILLPERADQRRPQEIPLSPEMTSREIETLVSGVQRQMKSWGIALDGGYWKPALSVDVRPGAEDRFAELKTVLQGSGIEVQRKIR